MCYPVYYCVLSIMNMVDKKLNRLFWFGVFLIVFGILFGLIWNPILKYFSAKKLVLRKNSQIYENWEETRIPMFLDFYIFNWTNPDKVYDEKPSFVEMGPYRYSEKMKKVNITFNPNGTVSYRLLKTWQFSPEGSYGSEDDMVTTINGIALTASHKAQYHGYFKKKTLSIAFSATNQKIAVIRSVKQLLFEGYEDTLITLGRKFNGESSSPYDRFGWFYGRNNSYKPYGHYNINTGSRDISERGALRRWNYAPRTKFFTSKCNQLQGTCGDMFSPGLKRDNKILIFSADVCRALKLEYEKDVEVEGVPVYRYVIDPLLFDNGTRVPGNECYCNGDCVPSGLLNLTQCRFGAPAFISLPHFLNADPFYANQVDGMYPDPNKHTIYMSVEPTFGYPLDARVRIQLNFLMHPVRHISLVEDLPTVFMPVLWIDHKSSITPEIGSTLRLATMIPSIGYTSAAVTILLGIVVVLVTLSCLKNEMLENENAVTPSMRFENTSESKPVL